MTADAITCEWRGGADRFTGSVASAIAAYGLPISTQTQLIEAWERRQFTDFIVIDRDSIRGKTHDYQADIRQMHFGSRGRVCKTVTRAGWSASHVESAVVLCADAECVAVPQVCSNVFRLTRAARATDGPEPSALVAGPVAGPDETQLGAPLADPQTPEAVTLGGDVRASLFSSGGSASTWGSIGGAYGPSFWPAAPQVHPGAVSPVPEPQTWALLALGVAGIAWRRAA
jgi:hypothetical protein